MKCRVEKGRIEWSWRGEHVCMEACADECIRVRASFKSPVDEELNYNLEPEKDVFSRIFLEPQNQTAGQDQMVKTEQEVDRAILECGRMQAVANAFGQITFYYDGKQILKEEWIDETCDMPPYQKARDFQGPGLFSCKFHRASVWDGAGEQGLSGLKRMYGGPVPEKYKMYDPILHFYTGLWIPLE